MAASYINNATLKRDARSIINSLLMALLAAFVSEKPAYAGEVLVRIPEAQFSVPVKSFQERSFFNTIKQQFDFSCGSAALATLLTHHYEHPISEQDIFLSMYDHGDKEKIKREGFSLLDMKNYLEANGFRADGFRLPLDKIMNVGVPAIVLINDEGYNHFVVLKGISDEHVLIGDPARGTRLLQRAGFTQAWNGIAFLIRSKRNIAVKYFNDAQEWQAAATAPLDMAIDRNMLADMTLFVRGANDF